MAYTTINKPSLYFNTVTYTGTGVSRNQTGVGFDPDWVWIKSRSNAYNNNVWDRVRGAGQRLITNDTGAEETQTGDMSAFVTDGITVGAGSITNANGATFVMWNWLANNTSGSSNTQGTITSTVSANQTAGFSIVSYTGNLTNGATVGHGLGVAPDMMIVRRRNNGDNWVVYSRAMSSNGDYYLYLQSTDTQSNLYNQFYDTAPTSSVFYLSNSNATNASGNTYINYCFASVKGYSKFGKYTGNGSTDGPFVYTGFKPAFVIIKNTTFASQYWQMIDNKRTPYNVPSTTGNFLFSNSADAEATSGNTVDFLSNGFKIRVAYDGTNYSGSTLIYMAFAENPFVSSTFIPTTAR